MLELRRGLRSKARRATPARLATALDVARNDSVLLVDWVNRGPVRDNWGDAVAPYLVERLSGRTVVNQRDVFNPRRRPVYTTIGSMLGSVRSAAPITVWGSGFVTTGQPLPTPIAEVRAVRGPLTRARLLELGVACPDVFGDPALLFPRFYRPQRTREVALGLIPHFKEIDMPWVRRLAAQDGVAVIDIRAGREAVADQVNRCERIATGSLHGLVLADAYGIPARWVKMTDRPGGDGFKFRDYLLSSGRVDVEPLRFDETTTVEHVVAEVPEVELTLDVDRFLDACPFFDEDAYRASVVPPSGELVAAG